MTINPHYRLLGLFALAAVVATLLSSCGSSGVTQSLSAEERNALGMKQFNDGDYLEAINDFQIVKLQFPGSRVADTAQYYLGECYFKREEYLLAAGEYQTLKRNFPASKLAPQAQYQIGLCYYHLSPKSALDQKYTDRAIDELQAFIEYNPTNPLVKDAEEKIQELNTRLAKKLYDIADVYMTMEYYRSAAIYFEAVIEKYHDTPYAEPALLGEVKALVARRHYEEARKEIGKFLDRYPNSDRRGEAEALKNDIDDHLTGGSSVSGDHTPTPAQ